MTEDRPGIDATDPTPEARDAYYRELAADYETKIRQLVPGYEEVMERMAELSALGEPDRILDIGCGTGELTERIAHAAPEARVTALEVAAPMAETARRRLQELGSRVEVLERDVLDAGRRPQGADPGGGPRRSGPGGEPLAAGSFQVVHTNFVLHNLPWAPKREALAAAYELLAEGGRLVWGDLIHFRDPLLQASQVDRRVRHARATGCREDLIQWNFRKEAQEDFPLTAEETLDVLRDTGFAEPEVAWARDTFLTVWARKA